MLALVQNSNPKRSFFLQILSQLWAKKCSLLSALPSHVCLYKTWWKYWKVSMRNPIETDFDVSLVSWFLTLKPDWPTKIGQYGFLKQKVALKPIIDLGILINICQELFSFKKDLDNLNGFFNFLFLSLWRNVRRNVEKCPKNFLSNFLFTSFFFYIHIRCGRFVRDFES